MFLFISILFLTLLLHILYHLQYITTLNLLLPPIRHDHLPDALKFWVNQLSLNFFLLFIPLLLLFVLLILSYNLLVYLFQWFVLPITSSSKVRLVKFSLNLLTEIIIVSISNYWFKEFIFFIIRIMIPFSLINSIIIIIIIIIPIHWSKVWRTCWYLLFKLKEMFCSLQSLACIALPQEIIRCRVFISRKPQVYKRISLWHLVNLFTKGLFAGFHGVFGAGFVLVALLNSDNFVCFVRFLLGKIYVRTLLLIRFHYICVWIKGW